MDYVRVSRIYNRYADSRCGVEASHISSAGRSRHKPQPCCHQLHHHLFGFLTLLLALYFISKTLDSRPVMTWQEIVADKLARLDGSIPAEWRLKEAPTDDSVMDYPAKSGILTEQELNITSLSAVDLLAKIAAGEFTAVAVVTAFSKRAAIAHQLVSPRQCKMMKILEKHLLTVPLPDKMCP